MARSPHYDVLVIGGGIYGCALAVELSRSRGARVLLLERERELLRRASSANQARVHNGYHYPRSMLTALRSRVNFPRFVADYKECIAGGFLKVYAISRHFSGVTARQFRLFCERIEAPLHPAPKSVRELFDSTYVEAVFQVKEPAFDWRILAARLQADLERHGVEVALGAEASRVASAGCPPLEVEFLCDGATSHVRADAVYNCTYSRVNKLLADSGLPLVPLKHELTEIALVEVPRSLRDLGVTVMCGPFFSLMPFPAAGLHSLSHVRYTPHREWYDVPGRAYRDPYAQLADAPRRSNSTHMIQDAMRYLPAVSESRHISSIWEVKTVLPKNEVDDGRPILMRSSGDLPGLHAVMGSKVDNVYDMIDSLPGDEASGTGVRHNEESR